MNGKYEFEGKIRYSEIDETGCLSLAGLVNYFQDVSTFQSEELGIGVEYLTERHQAWILSSWQIVIDHLPKLCESVKAQTWAYDFQGFYGMRNFVLLGADGEPAARANSIWVLYDTRENRPVRVPEDMAQAYPMLEPLEMEYAPRKIRLPQGGESRETFAIGRHQLDTNHHVNNGQYIAMAAEYLPAGFKIRQMRAEYKMQARLHDEICPRVYTEENQVIVALCSSQGKPYAVVAFEERRKEQDR